MSITNTIEIAAPVQRVWDLTVDVTNWPTLFPTVTEVEVLNDEPLRVGSRARIKQPAQRAHVWTVTDYEPNKLFAWSTKAMGVHMEGRHELHEHDGTTTNTLSIVMSGRFARIAERLMTRPVAKTIATENAGFKQAAERPSA